MVQNCEEDHAMSVVVNLLKLCLLVLKHIGKHDYKIRFNAH